jgi:hypothetical protein
MLLFLLIMLWAIFRWRRRHAWGWCLLVGFFGMWAFMCHPSEAVCYFPPLGLAMLWDMRRDGLKRIATTLAALTLSAAPLIAVQVISNIGIVGHWYKLPYAVYVDRYYPSYRLGFPEYRPTQQPLPQMKDLDQLFSVQIRQHTVANIVRSWAHYKLPEMGRSLLANVLLLLFIPLGFLGLREPFRLAIVSSIVLFALLYSFYAFMLRWYPIPLIPAVFLLLLLGIDALRRFRPDGRFFTAFPALMVAVLAVCALPQFDSYVDDGQAFPARELRHIDAAIAADVRPPAIVLFHYARNAGLDPHEEPAYNDDVAWPDNAPIIKAHDLGPQNIRLIRYYAARQPRRRVYRYDRPTERLTYLGTAESLAQHP